MIQRTILRQCRVAGQVVRVSPRASLLRPQFRPHATPASQTLRQVTAARWYATEPELKNAADGEAETAGSSQSETVKAEDSSKKELEAKNKEIVDLKVCATPGSVNRYSTDILPFRTSTYGLLPSFATCKSEPSERFSRQKTLLSRDLPRIL